MNIYIFIVCVVFGYIKIDYFGWNSGAQSEAEVICDGIMLLLFSLSVLNRKKDITKC